MNDFSLMPVDHQPDFDDISLVPVDHDPFAADATTQPAQVQAQTQTPPTPLQSTQVQMQSQPAWLAAGAGQPDAGVPAKNGPPGVAGDSGVSSFPPASDTQVAANDGMPGNNQAQNAQVRAIQVEFGLSDAQRDRLHQEISGQGYGYHEIRQIAIDMFGK
jgi:hypothetical protein